MSFRDELFLSNLRIGFSFKVPGDQNHRAFGTNLLHKLHAFANQPTFIKERLPDRVCRKASDQIKETWIDQDARLFFYLAVTIGLDHCLEASPAAFHQIGSVQAGSNAPISADRRDISLT